MALSVTAADGDHMEAPRLEPAWPNMPVSNVRNTVMLLPAKLAVGSKQVVADWSHEVRFPTHTVLPTAALSLY
jgi:hypothetical protein